MAQLKSVKNVKYFLLAKAAKNIKLNIALKCL